MALKFKNPFGPGFSRSGKAGRRFRELQQEERKRKEQFRRLQGKPRRTPGVRT